MVNISDRWNRDKINDLQFAFFNGEGWESWENIWGIWNGITPRDAEATRRVATIERAVAPFLSSADWEPLYPMHHYGVFASRWPRGHETVWTIVNRNEYDVRPADHGAVLPRACATSISTTESNSSPNAKADEAVLTFHIEATRLRRHAGDRKTSPRRTSRYADGEDEANDRNVPGQLIRTNGSCSSSNSWKSRDRTRRQSAPDGMVRSRPRITYSGCEALRSRVSTIPVSMCSIRGKPSRAAIHEHTMHIPAFYMDKYPVTNAQFKKFLDATHYHPSR